MPKMYRRIDLRTGEPVNYVGVHPDRWLPYWGRPTAGFVEVGTTEDKVSREEMIAYLKSQDYHYDPATCHPDHEDCASTPLCYRTVKLIRHIEKLDIPADVQENLKDWVRGISEFVWCSEPWDNDARIAPSAQTYLDALLRSFEEE